ncbi:MAG: D-cysteine desulfhydrase family protein [Deltaproteobacteria bacterium]|nr:D-cysteine desulfhydrase family protein [Deltaproteobacteria bacterium]
MSKRTRTFTVGAGVTYPPSVELARLHTPLQLLDHISERFERTVYCKRDDLTGAALSGNKVRKLEFLLAALTDGGHGGVITCGGEQSNHARATALAAARLGLRCHLLLRTKDPSNPPEPTGNILLDQLAGATIEWITPDAYAERDELLERRATELQSEHGVSFSPIPEGGSNALGAWGYVRCVAELAEQLGPGPVTIVSAVGSGGTTAGLIAGCQLYNLPYRVVGIAVSDDRATFQGRIAKILAEMAETFEEDVAVEAEGIEIIDDYVGRGYALSSEEELRCIVDMARESGLILDPVYTAKAMVGLLGELKKAQRNLGEKIVFIHTGGIFGLLPKAAELKPLL